MEKLLFIPLVGFAVLLYWIYSSLKRTITYDRPIPGGAPRWLCWFYVIGVRAACVGFVALLTWTSWRLYSGQYEPGMEDVYRRILLLLFAFSPLVAFIFGMSTIFRKGL